MSPAERRRLDDARLPHGTSTFGLFSEVLLVGAVTAALSLPVLTALPAMASGVAHLRRHLDGRPDALTVLWADFGTALRRGGWAFSLGWAVLLLVLGFNVTVAASGLLPAAPLVRAVSVLLAVALVVVALRSCGAWEPASSWRAAVRIGARRAVADVAGSALLAVAVGLCALIVWMLTPLVLVVPGLLALAVVAVEHRAHARGRVARP